MRARTLYLLACVTLLGCATEAHKPKEALLTPEMMFEQEFAGGLLCSNTYCSLSVVVGANCRVSVPTLGVAASVEDAVIHWSIDPSSVGTVAFAGNGINPKEPGAWNREFRNGSRVSATEFTWVDKNKLAGAPRKRTYLYNIEVTQDGKPCRLDPGIVNDY